MVVLSPPSGETLAAPREGAAFLRDAVLGSYSQILFTRSRVVGILILAATFTAPVTGAFGLGAVFLSVAVSRGFAFPDASIRAGIFGYNAMLVGLGIGALLNPSIPAVLLAAAAVVLAVVATATLASALGASFNLPSLSLPFLLVFYLVLSFAQQIAGVELVAALWDPQAAGEAMPHVVASYLRSLGAIFFLPRWDAGLLVMVAVLAFSRIGFVLTLVGFAVAYPVSMYAVAVPDAELHLMMGFNLMLTAVALGGVWFVPRPASFALAAVAAVLAAVLALAGRTLLGRLGLPLLILPFNFIVIPMLYAMRQRVRDGAPKAVDFAMGTPEQNLNYYQTRLARFGDPYAVPLHLPFLGRWRCTQGNDGPHTHKDLWRHGLDFEVIGADDRTFRAGGRAVEDYHCWRLPVLAPADGTVVKVVDDVADNEIGEINATDNWGNLVLLYHGPGLYTLMAHLAEGSAAVTEGAAVKRGAKLGLCGNSGRSPVPHLHVQVQGTERVGAPTLPIAFREVVLETPDGETLHGSATPDEGQTVRNLEREPGLARLFEFPLGEALHFDLTTPRWATSRVSVEPRIDLYGNLSLTASGRGGALWFENKAAAFTVYDHQGAGASLLAQIHLALPRVPFEAGVGLRWRDHLVSRQLFSPLRRVLRDFAAPFLGRGGIEMAYRLERAGDALTVFGESAEQGGDAAPRIVTRAVLRDGTGIERIEVRMRDGITRAVRRPNDDDGGTE